MFGLFRFLLAFGVLWSHTAPINIGIHLGVASVVVFYIISGYVTTGLLRRHYSQPKHTHLFYLDRILRIYPQYLFFLLLTFAALFFGWFHLTPEYSNPTPIHILSNILLIPLNYYMYSTAWGTAWIPPAWSLGAELQFYLILPFIFLFFRLRLFFILLSLGVFTLASLGYLATNIHSYRLLTGVLFIFLWGSLFYDYQQDKRQFKYWIGGIYVYLLLFYLFLVFTKTLNSAENSGSIFTGLLFGFPMFCYLSGLPRKARDEMWGNLSYGLFLSHFFVLWFLERWSFFHLRRGVHANLYIAGIASVLKISLTFVGACILSYIGYRYIEMPIVRWRQKMRLSSNQKE